jgi:hypothetical protein
VSPSLRGGGHGTFRILQSFANLRPPCFFLRSASFFNRFFLSATLSLDVFLRLRSAPSADAFLRSSLVIDSLRNFRAADLIALFIEAFLFNVFSAESVGFGGMYSTPSL